MQKFPIVLTCLLVLTILVSGCAAPPATAVPPTTAPAAAATTAPAQPAAFDWKMHQGEKLRVAMVTQPWSEFIQKDLQAFKDLTGIDINYEILPEDQFRQKTTVEFAAGTSDVDVFLSMVAQEGIKYESAGWYADIQSFLDNEAITDPDFDFADFTPSSLGIAKLSNGKLVGLPVYNEYGSIMYNKELFDKAGVKYPPKTMDDVVAAAKAIHNPAEGIYGIAGRGKGAACTSQWSSIMHSFGVDWVDADGKSAVMDPKFAEAIKWYGDLLNQYGQPGATSHSWNQAQDVFINGKSGMWMDASIFFPNVVDPAQSKIVDKVGITMAPEGPAGRIPYVGGWHLSIYNQSKHKEAAWLFVQWALGKDMVKKAQLANITTARTSAWESEEFKAANQYPEAAATYLAAMEIADARWNPPVLAVSEARDAIGAVLVKAIEGTDFTADLKAADAKMTELLEATPQLK